VVDRDGARSGVPPSPLMIAIDGPGGSGKSTVSRVLAERLGLGFLDTGATYRAVTLAALQQDLALEDCAALGALARDLAHGALQVSTEVTDRRTLLNGADVSVLIRGPQVTAAVSQVAAVPAVRQALVAWQRQLALSSVACVVEGRDIGVVVLPEAELKVWLTASVDVRAARRAREAERGAIDQAAALARRDALDASRELDPMRPPPDAVILDSTGLTVAQVVARLTALLPTAVRS